MTKWEKNSVFGFFLQKDFFRLNVINDGITHTIYIYIKYREIDLWCLKYKLII